MTTSRLRSSSQTLTKTPTCCTSAKSNSQARRSEINETLTEDSVTPKRAFGCALRLTSDSTTAMSLLSSSNTSSTCIHLESPSLPTTTTTAWQPMGAAKTRRSRWPLMWKACLALRPPPTVATQVRATSIFWSDSSEANANSTLSPCLAQNSTDSSGAASDITGVTTTSSARREKFRSSYWDPCRTVRNITPLRSATSTLNMRESLCTGL
mmetsp:Transcript_10134/g.28346  ORF Transcript_10134/g.28346 Transcript_10134/m.28346 type:complete len:210 (+) Transcript_10134:542-1171(+)